VTESRQASGSGTARLPDVKDAPLEPTATIPPGAAPRERRSILSTTEGASSAAFTPTDWLLLAMAAGIWGSSFLLIAIGLDSFGPTVITWLRMVFGFAALVLIPAARRPIDRADLPRLALIGVFWMALPMTMFPIAEQWIDSSVVGMLNGALPIFSGLMAALLLRRAPGRAQQLGLAVGFVGVVLVSLPSLRGTDDTALGAALVIVAMVSYGIATNLVVPMQQRYGALPVILRAQVVAIALTTPAGLWGLPDTSFEWRPFLAIVALGALGTGLAFYAGATLMGRVGATRGSLLGYLIPVVAVVLGVVLRDEPLEVISLAGMVLVLAGAFVASRAGR
jgi:drug/metabolite transporter (DMT)-like permease